MPQSTAVERFPIPPMLIIQPSARGASSLRVVVRPDGPWFVALDVCAVLGIVNSSDAVGRLDDDEKGIGTADPNGGQQKYRLVNESGLYSLIMTSRRPEARAFRRWVTSEVLPSIRKTGSYVTPAALPVSYADALRALALEVEERQALEARELEAAPKVAAYEAFMDADGTALIGAAAKALGIGPNKLFALLRVKGVLMDHPGEARHNMPYQDHVDNGRFVIVAGSYERPDGVEVATWTTHVTPKGMAYLAKLVQGARTAA